MLVITIPKALADFSMGRLNGWRKNRLVVSNNPDPRIADFDFESTVMNHWQKSEPSRFKRGFIRFRNGKKFDRDKQTIDGVRKYLFEYREVLIYWSIYLERIQLISLVDQLNDGDLISFDELVTEIVDKTAKVSYYFRPRIWAEHSLAERFNALGLSQLRELTAMLKAGRHQEMQSVA